MEAMGPALPPGFGSSRYEPTDSSNPGDGWENGYIGDGQAANRKCTAHTRHRGWPAVESSLFATQGCLPNRPNGGCRLVGLSKRAKKHSITADCGELKATFGPRLRGTAKQQVKH